MVLACFSKAFIIIVPRPLPQYLLITLMPTLALCRTLDFFIPAQLSEQKPTSSPSISHTSISVPSDSLVICIKAASLSSLRIISSG